MRRRRPTRRILLASGAGLFVALLLGTALGRRDSDAPPAAPAVLSHIAHKNRDAAIEAAARMKAESEAAARASDARQDQADAAEASGSSARPPR